MCHRELFGLFAASALLVGLRYRSTMDVKIPPAFRDVLQVPEVVLHSFPDDGTFPNNDERPTLILRKAFRSSVADLASQIARVFQANNWRGTWRNGVFSYHHYHSTSHEVLGVSQGRARLQLGGPDGEVLDVEAGDVMVLPAGVAHKNLGAGAHFQVVGAYPNGRQWDLKTGTPDERPEADRNIAEVPLPAHDPVYGESGPVVEHWGTG